MLGTILPARLIRALGQLQVDLLSAARELRGGTVKIMHRRSVGLGLIILAAFLYASRFFLVVFFSHAYAGSLELFDKMYAEIGFGLTGWAIVSLLAGVSYIVWGEIEEWLKGVRH
jgi:hypothetical protein